MPVLLADVSGADGAAGALLCIRAVRDRRAPDMPIRTEPPDLAVAACCDHFGCERTIERRMPFGGNFRFDTCKIVEAYKHFLVYTVRTAFAASQVLPVFFASVTGHGQHGKPLAEIVFQRRMAQTAAAFPVARRKLVQWRVNFTATVALAAPDGVAVFSLRRCFYNGQVTNMKTCTDFRWIH